MHFEVADGAAKGEALLFRNVRNAALLRPLLASGALDAALVDASLVLDMFQVLVAANIAAEKLARGRLVSRNVHTEVLYNLSAGRNVGRALATFGVSSASEYILAVVLHPTAGKVAAVRAAVAGDEVADVPAALARHADRPRVRRVYAVPDREAAAGGGLLHSVATRIACRDVL